VILVLCCLAQFLGVLDVSIVNVGLASIRADLSFSTGALQWVVNAYTLACAGFLLLGGRAADLFGRREVFVAGLALFGTASLAAGLAQEPATLVAARAGQGLGGAVMAPTSLSILATIYDEGPERNRAFGLWGTMGALGGACGALLGGVLVELLSWRWLLLVNGPLALALALAALRVIPPLRRRPGAVDLPGALAVTAGLVALTYGIVSSRAGGWAAPSTLVPLAAGVVLLGLFALVEARVAGAPLVPPRILRSRLLTGAVVVVFCLGAAAVSLWFFLSLYLREVRGLSALETGLTFAPMSLAILACTQLASRLAGRLGAGRVLAAGMTLLGAGLLGLARTDAVLVPSLLCASGIGCSFVSTTIAATTGVAREDSGLAAGVLNTAFQVGGSLGLATIALAEGFHGAFAAAAGVALTGAVVAAVVMARG
jgi:EmrB/QacA subfamily drug resistance transporter